MKQNDASINDYLAALSACDNEAQKKEQFVILLSQLFPEHASLIRKFGGGAEKFVKYTTHQLTDKKTGKIDSLYGNLVIEFEYDLGKTGGHAEDQLKEYIAKLWSKEKVKTDYVGITTDGLNWNVYTPSLDRSKLTANVFASSDVQLVKNEPYRVNSKNAAEFYMWLDRIFFRENSIRPEGKIICSEFGVNSPHYCRSMIGLLDVFQRAKGMKEVQVAFVNWRKYLQFTYGDIEASEELFVAHTYLSAFTKILMAGVLSARKDASFDSSQITAVLSGRFFYDLNIRNYVERDFFYWINFEDVMGATAPLWTATYNLLRAYSFSHVDEDFLKEIYQGLVDPVDREILSNVVFELTQAAFASTLSPSTNFHRMSITSASLS